MWNWMNGGWWWAGAACMVVFWGAVIWAVLALRRRSDGPARSVLDERLARGEIDEAEYQQSRDLIRR